MEHLLLPGPLMGCVLQGVKNLGNADPQLPSHNTSPIGQWQVRQSTRTDDPIGSDTISIRRIEPESARAAQLSSAQRRSDSGFPRLEIE
ncbi:unnamed protein product [Protopolystoma xenopodis]|uniref:Uncharacterized protein n=1 Tax=Protopolystoma xenopodis TaxID=117903 RepID=A0A3S4ZFN0_9PLAT|nr:unnamed protein product [Protopolystoma xenopodis]